MKCHEGGVFDFDLDTNCKWRFNANENESTQWFNDVW